jgi:DNA-directed RNA polymerase specialized sigma24 family protein
MSRPLRLHGDEAELFARHHGTLNARVTRWVKTSAANIDDACSTAWLQLLRSQPRRDSALSWLTTVAIREAVRLHRAQGRTRHVDSDDLANEYALNPDLQRDALDALDTLASLPDRQRRLAGLQAAGFSYDEIAALSRVADVASA